jgi:hypothetical protein
VGGTLHSDLQQKEAAQSCWTYKSTAHSICANSSRCVASYAQPLQTRRGIHAARHDPSDKLPSVTPQTKDSRSARSFFASKSARIGAEGLASALCRLGISTTHTDSPLPSRYRGTRRISENGQRRRRTARQLLGWGRREIGLGVWVGGFHYCSALHHGQATHRGLASQHKRAGLRWDTDVKYGCLPASSAEMRRLGS